MTVGATVSLLTLLVLASLLDPAVTPRLGWPAGRLLLATVAVIGVASLATAFQRTLAIARALERGTPGGR